MQNLIDTEEPKRAFFPCVNLIDLNVDPYYRNLDIEDFLIAEDGNLIKGFIALWYQSEYKRIKIESRSPRNRQTIKRLP